MTDTLKSDDTRLLRGQRLEIILESDGKRVIEIITSTGIHMKEGQCLLLPCNPPFVKATPKAGKLLGSFIDLYKERFNSLYHRLIIIGETLFPNNYSIKTKIKPYRE